VPTIRAEVTVERTRATTHSAAIAPARSRSSSEVVNSCLSGRTGSAKESSSPCGRKPMRGRILRVISLPPVASINETFIAICRMIQIPAPGYAGSAAQSITCAAGTTAVEARTCVGQTAACATMVPLCRAVKLREPDQPGRVDQYFHAIWVSASDGSSVGRCNVRRRNPETSGASSRALGRRSMLTRAVWPARRRPRREQPPRDGRCPTQ
jgi:hypothetical protein